MFDTVRLAYFLREVLWPQCAAAAGANAWFKRVISPRGDNFDWKLLELLEEKSWVFYQRIDTGSGST